MGPTALAFTNDGKYVIVGYKDGSVSVFCGDKVDAIFNSKIAEHGAPITTLHWHESIKVKHHSIKLADHCLHLKTLENLDPKPQNPKTPAILIK